MYMYHRTSCKMNGREEEPIDSWVICMCWCLLAEENQWLQEMAVRRGLNDNEIGGETVVLEPRLDALGGLAEHCAEWTGEKETPKKSQHNELSSVQLCHTQSPYFFLTAPYCVVPATPTTSIYLVVGKSLATITGSGSLSAAWEIHFQRGKTAIIKRKHTHPQAYIINNVHVKTTRGFVLAINLPETYAIDGVNKVSKSLKYQRWGEDHLIAHSLCVSEMFGLCDAPLLHDAANLANLLRATSPVTIYNI